LFPTIFGCAVRDLGPHIKSASALLIMASGSANMLLPIMSLIRGPAAIQYVMLLIPCLCFCAIFVFAMVQRRATDRLSQQPLPEAGSAADTLVNASMHR
jgi:fucose permease